MERSINLCYPVEFGTKSSSAGDGAATVYATLQPPVGQLYLVDYAAMWHDDNGGNRVMYWYIYDGSTRTALWATPTAIANGLYYPLYRSDAGCPNGGHPFLLSYSHYLQAACVAAAAGKKAYMQYVVRVIHGVEPWTNS